LPYSLALSCARRAAPAGRRRTSPTGRSDRDRLPGRGPTDFVGRLVADKVKDILGQTIIIENKPGANGAIGADYVAKSRPTATTLFS
jgi:hypothetical protein